MLKLSLGALGGNEEKVEVPKTGVGEGNAPEDQAEEEDVDYELDKNFGKLQAPAARPAPIYNKTMFAQFNPALDKDCGMKPFPRQQAVPEPPAYVAGNMKIPKKPSSRSASVSDTARAAWPRALDTPPDHRILCTPTQEDTYR